MEQDMMCILNKVECLHVINMFLSSLLVDEVSQGSWDIKVLRPLFTHLFVGKIYGWRTGKVISLTR